MMLRLQMQFFRSSSSSCLIHSSSYFSCSLSTQTTAAAEKKTKSPHSKLLRVCSSRNTNPHFAAIESEMIRLNWDESMKKLVADWTKNRRFEEFLELERNVKSYVDNNLPFLKLEKDSYLTKEGILMQFFPYESIISSLVRFSVSFSSTNNSTLKFDRIESNIAMNDLQKRMETLKTAGLLLEAMSTLETHQTDDDSNGSEAADIQYPYYKSCMSCYRLVVSGWFLLFRRQKALHDKIIAELNATDALQATSKVKTHPDSEAFEWAKKWISFNSKLGSGGIMTSDKELLIGILKVLSPHRQEAATELKGMLNNIIVS